MKEDSPKEGEYTKKESNRKTYHWCKYHIAWMLHDPKAPRDTRYSKNQQMAAEQKNHLPKDTTNVVTTTLRQRSEMSEVGGHLT